MSFDQTALNRDERTIFALRALYQQYGYARFKMGKFEEYDLYVRNKDFLVSDRMITFTDPSGTLLALKPDVTISIIKNTKEGDFGVRKVYYNENVYRTAKGGDSFREIMQTGLECIGDLDPYHIFEVTALAVQSLQSISAEYVLDISHMGLVSGLMESAGVPEEQFSRVLHAVREKNAGAIKLFCQEKKLSEVSCQLLLRLVSVYGGMEEVLQNLAPLCQSEKTKAAWDTLATLSQLLTQNGLAEHVQLDFSVVNDMNYYNGIVFQGFVKGLSAGVLSGGQYDKLVQKMGKHFGAIGFAIYLDELERLYPFGQDYDCDVLLRYDDRTALSVLTATVAELTQAGKSVWTAREETETRKYRELIDLRGQKEAEE